MSAVDTTTAIHAYALEHNAQTYAHALACGCSGAHHHTLEVALAGRLCCGLDSWQRQAALAATGAEARIAEIEQAGRKIRRAGGPYADRCPCGAGTALNPCERCLSPEAVAR